MTRPALAALAFLGSALGSAGPALAWSEPECARLEQGQPMCAVTTWYDLGGQAGRLKIMLADGEPFLLLQNDGWRLPEGPIPVLAHLDDQPPIERTATAQGDGVLMTLQGGDLEALARGQSITIAMPQAEITFPLAGSLEALDALLQSYAAFAAGPPSAG